MNILPAPWWKQWVVFMSAGIMAMVAMGVIRAPLVAWLGLGATQEQATTGSMAWALAEQKLHEFGSGVGATLITLPVGIFVFLVSQVVVAWWWGVTGIIREETGIGAMIAVRAPGIQQHPAYPQLIERAAVGRTQCRYASLIFTALGAVIVVGFGAAAWIGQLWIDTLRSLVGPGTPSAVAWVIPLVLLALVVPLVLLVGTLLEMFREVFRER